MSVGDLNDLLLPARVRSTKYLGMSDAELDDTWTGGMPLGVFRRRTSLLIFGNKQTSRKLGHVYYSSANQIIMIFRILFVDFY